MCESEQIELRDDTGFIHWFIDEVGYDRFVAACQLYGGQRIYLPKAPAIEERDREIRRRFIAIIQNGYKPNLQSIYENLGEKFGITRRQVENILSK